MEGERKQRDMEGVYQRGCVMGAWYIHALFCIIGCYVVYGFAQGCVNRVSELRPNCLTE
jgi:hypothetical protein